MLKSPNYTQISNDFIDSYMANCSGAEAKIFIAISRKTIGYHKTTDRISYTQLNKLTGLSINSIKKAVADLINKQIITQHQSANGYSYDLNIDITKETVSENDIGGYQKMTPLISKNDTVNVSENDTTKEIFTKENKKDKENKEILILPVHKLITKSIAYWNTKTNLPRYRFNRANIPSDIFRDISSHLSVFKPEEINKAIDNLSDNYKKEDPSFRVSSFQSFAIKSIDRWIDDVKPWERYQDDSALPDCAPQESTVPGWIKKEGATFE